MLNISGKEMKFNVHQRESVRTRATCYRQSEGGKRISSRSQAIERSIITGPLVHVMLSGGYQFVRNDGTERHDLKAIQTIFR